MEVWRNGMKIIGWQEDNTRKGSFVLTIRTPRGGTIQAVESQLSSEQVKELKNTVSKNETIV